MIPVEKNVKNGKYRPARGWIFSANHYNRRNIVEIINISDEENTRR
ncbi:MAG: hypothetical protein AB7D17_05800 [Methanobacteriales archaeon]